MLQPVEPAARKLLTRAELDAYDPEAESWQRQFARRYQHHSEWWYRLAKMQDVDDAVYGKFAVAITPYMAQLMDPQDPNLLLIHI